MQSQIKYAIRLSLICALVTGSLWIASSVAVTAVQSRPQQDQKEQPYVIEYYYKAKWGHAEEFLALFKKNHYPMLKKEIEMGRMLKVTMAVPRYHATEDGRWDYRVTIVFRDAATANDNFDSESLIRKLYPDQETYKQEEQRRFEILESHWDLPIRDANLDGR
jgi:hypothetical protein